MGQEIDNCMSDSIRELDVSISERQEWKQPASRRVSRGLDESYLYAFNEAVGKMCVTYFKSKQINMFLRK